MTRTNVYWLIALAVTFAAWVASAIVYPSMPARIPTHWNIRGEIDGYGAKTWAVFMMPAMLIGFLLLFWLLPVLSPKNFEVEPFRSTYLFIMVTVVGLFTYIHAVMLYAAWSHVDGKPAAMDIGRVLIGGMFLFLALIGNVLGKVRRNFYIGVRVPWTLASERVWNDTHRLAAWTMVAGSLVGFLLVILGVSLVIAFAIFMVAALVPIVYSFVHYKQLERRGAL
jgi:uncharacterized membrane protein